MLSNDRSRQQYLKGRFGAPFFVLIVAGYRLGAFTLRQQHSLTHALHNPRPIIRAFLPE